MIAGARDLKKGVLDEKLQILFTNGLLFTGSRLIISWYKHLREHLFQLAHDNMGHFRASKSYASLQDEFYWPHMWKNLMEGCILSCPECQRNRSQTVRAPGPLHPLPILDKCFESVALDFVGPLPKDDGYDMIVTMMDWLGPNL